jgi:hypothetical protein
MPAPAGKSDDPSYKLYKVGYDLVLDEKWQDARKSFADFLKKYPKSSYADDAEYWSAYALEHELKDKDKAFKAFKDFVYKYPESNYYDDAIAEMYRLKGDRLFIGKASGRGGVNVYMDDDGSFHRAAMAASVASGIGRAAAPATAAPVAIAPSLPNVSWKVRSLQRQMSRAMSLAHTDMHTPRPRTAFPLLMIPEDENISPETRLKMQALSALGDTKEDSVSFATLRDVALDRSQDHRLRETAMDALSNYTLNDPLPVYLEIAKKDTSEELQNMAIDYIGQLTNNKNRSLETLTELFDAIPPRRTDRLDWILSSIAEVGNDKAVDFLRNVALNNTNYDLRSAAVSYLGNIGSDHARRALYEVVRTK